MRPTITPRSEAPFSRLDEVLIQMIEAHAGRPCPTRKEVMEWTGMPRRRIWAYLDGMVQRGLIEMDVAGTKECGKDPKLRRMRVVGKSDWTRWTARGRRLESAA